MSYISQKQMERREAAIKTKCFLENSRTGIDLAVKSVKEVEAPLGGTSVEYELTVVSNLNIFKPSDDFADDIVQYSIFKTYREFDDLVSKLKKKHPQHKFLVLPKTLSSAEDKRSACDHIMKLIARNSDLVDCDASLQFLGIDLESKKLIVDISPQSVTATIEIEEKPESGSDEKEDFDLFEELVRKEKEKKTTVEEIDVLEKKETVAKEIFAAHNTQQNKLLLSKNTLEVKRNTDLYHDLFSDGPKSGNVLMFEEQDYGEFLTKEEEELFLIPEEKPTEVSNATKEVAESAEKHEDVFRIGDDEKEDSLLKQSDLETKKDIPVREMKEMTKPKQSSLTSTTTDSSPSNPKQSNKPAPPPKPKSLVKPTPPPKPQPVSAPSGKAVKIEAADSGELDIFKYIEQEEKANMQEANLFD